MYLFRDKAAREWASCSRDTLYLMGSTVDPHPFPMMVASFQRVMGDEIRAHFMKREDRLPEAVLACGSGGSNALGALKAFLDDEDVRLYFVARAG
jgi:tryptophan synthase beta chain